MASLKEKIGYGFGDMASSMFWKVFSYYLPFFYSQIFGLSLTDAGLLLIVTRIWDAVSDPMMGVIADRTNTRWGKYRPYLLWVAPFFSICGILLFTTPDWGYAGKLIWAYVTYILMMTVYTGINVPYGAMLGVMTDDTKEKTVFSSFRMFFAYGGSFIALFLCEPICNYFADHFGCSPSTSWQLAMVVIASACFILFLLCFSMTREHLHTVSEASVGSDLATLMRNKPWWIMNGAAICSNLFNTVRGSAVAYFFTFVIGDHAQLDLYSGITFAFYAGLFLGIGEIANMVGVALTVPVAGRLGKKTTYILVNMAMLILSIVFFWLPLTGAGYWWMIILQILISLCTGIMSPLVWSMYADVSDYAELEYRTASTGLIFSSASMAQKIGGAFGGAAVMWLLADFGFVENAAVQPDSAISCLWWMMSFIPAIVAAVAIIIIFFYPLTTARVAAIVDRLKEQRRPIPTPPAQDPALN